VLENYGAAVTAVASAAEALAEFERARPDVMLSDLGMAGETGYDLMHQIAARDASLPAAAITAFGELADSRHALAAGFKMQLAKPIGAEALVAAVAELAGRRFARSTPAAASHRGRAR
jgi:CheY-like chemotaxis protein